MRWVGPSPRPIATGHGKAQSDHVSEAAILMQLSGEVLIGHAVSAAWSFDSLARNERVLGHRASLKTTGTRSGASVRLKTPLHIPARPRPHAGRIFEGRCKSHDSYRGTAVTEIGYTRQPSAALAGFHSAGSTSSSARAMQCATHSLCAARVEARGSFGAMDVAYSR